MSVHWDRSSPLLLGYSGGPDSKALLYALLECGVRPHLAHVDHGWREESKKEALLLAEEAAALRCPFHTTRLTVEKSEDAAREGRLSFFRSLGISPVLLAHQANDLAETVLKRVLEGAHLSRLGGMQPVSSQKGLVIWRPFLFLEKGEIMHFLQERNLPFFLDATNCDPKYLRSRLRQDIFPFLEKNFGKRVQGNLTLLSERAFELRKYLDQKTASIRIERGSWGVKVDLNGVERVEGRHLLQTLGHFSRNSLEQILDTVKSGEQKDFGKGVSVTGGWVFFLG